MSGLVRLVHGANVERQMRVEFLQRVCTLHWSVRVFLGGSSKTFILTRALTLNLTFAPPSL